MVEEIKKEIPISAENPSLRLNPKIVVTGGGGYLGSILVPMLLDSGYRVHVIDRFYFGRNSLANLEKNPNLKITEADILHHENVPHLFEGVRALIHLASISNDPSGDLDPNLTIQTNFLATMSLARRAKAEGVKQMVFISSCSVYGASADKFLDETSPVGPVTLYALSKLQCENELIPMADNSFSITILRFATLFGYSPRMRFDLAVNVMAKRSLQGKNLFVNGDGRQYRPFLHVKDAARSILYIINSDPSLVNKKVFNVGNENLNFMIKDLAVAIKSYFPHIPIENIAFNNDARSYRVQFNRFKEYCGFQAKYGIEDGLAEITNAHKAGLLENMDHENYYNLEIMKKILQNPKTNYSLASTPRWMSNGEINNNAVKNA